MYLGIDIGGTSVKMGLVKENGEILARHEASVSFDNYETPILTTVVREAHVLLHGWTEPLQGIGVSATGRIDPVTGVVTEGNDVIRNWVGSRVNETLSREFGAVTSSINDADAAVIGEAFTGNARGLSDVLLVTVGTGIGGGIITGGRILLGRDGAAGEIGSMPLFLDREEPGDPRKGYYERYASTLALVERVEEATGRKELNGRKICALVREGDEKVKKAFDAWLRDLSVGIAALVNTLNPEVVLIGGGISAEEELIMQPLKELICKRSLPSFARGLRVEAASLHNDAGIVGAVKFCMEQQGK